MRPLQVCIALVALPTLLSARDLAGQSRPMQVLRPLDSIRVAERGDTIVSSVIAVAVAGSRVFIGDGGESRVLEVGPRGNITRVFGRKGRGPGELITPGTLAIGGDTALFVLDNGERRISVFHLKTGRFVRSTTATGYVTSARVADGALMVAQFDDDTHTSIATLGPDGQRTATEGPIPPLGLKYPFIRGLHAQTAFTRDGNQVYAAYLLAQSLFSWHRGMSDVSEIPVPASRRRGVKEATFEALIRDPSRGRELGYAMSFPAALSVVAPGALALLTFDPTLVGPAFTGVYHLTLVDAARRRVCPDVEVPAPHDPLPRASLDGRVLVVVFQTADAGGSLATIVRRFAIDPAACKWEPIR